MLQFVYSLQDLYSRVRSFIFVADIGEVTDCFRNNDAKEALEKYAALVHDDPRPNITAAAREAQHG